MEITVLIGLFFITLGVITLLYLKKYPVDGRKFLGIGAASIRPRAWLSIIIGSVLMFYSIASLIRT